MIVDEVALLILPCWVGVRFEAKVRAVRRLDRIVYHPDRSCEPDHLAGFGAEDCALLVEATETVDMFQREDLHTTDFP